MKRTDRSSRLGLFLVTSAAWTLALSGAASGQTCTPPEDAATGRLELRHGEVRLIHQQETDGIRDIVNASQGYVAGPWHVPLGLTVAEFDTRFETRFRYRKAQSHGYCVALSEAKVSIGYDHIIMYVSRIGVHDFFTRDHAAKHQLIRTEAHSLGTLIRVINTQL